MIRLKRIFHSKKMNNEELAAYYYQTHHEIYFEKLFERNYEYAMCICLRYTDLDYQEIEDIISEAFIKLADYLKHNSINTSFKSLLYRTIENKIIDALRKREPKSKHVFLNDIPHNGKIIEDIYKKDFMAKLSAALNQLPIRQRDSFIFHHIQEKSYEEIVEESEDFENIMQVKGCVQRARKTLKKLLPEFENQL